MPFTAQQIKAARLHLLKCDPVMKTIVRQVGPCQIKTNRDRFRTLASSIVSQQISGAAARTVWSRLENALAPSVINAESLGQLNVDRLRECGVSRQKASYLLDLSHKTLSGEIDFKKLTKLDDEEIIAELTRIKGIGRWTAQMFLMFTICRTDVLPVDDLGIKNAIKASYNLRKLPDNNRIEKIARPWRPHATIASWYLWRSLDNQGAV